MGQTTLNGVRRATDAAAQDNPSKNSSAQDKQHGPSKAHQDPIQNRRKREELPSKQTMPPKNDLVNTFVHLPLDAHNTISEHLSPHDLVSLSMSHKSMQATSRAMLKEKFQPLKKFISEIDSTQALLSALGENHSYQGKAPKLTVKDAPPALAAQLLAMMKEPLEKLVSSGEDYKESAVNTVAIRKALLNIPEEHRSQQASELLELTLEILIAHKAEDFKRR